MKPKTSLLQEHLEELQLSFIKNHHSDLAQQAAQAQWSHVDYLSRLIQGEFHQRRQRRIERRIQAARFPVLKTLEQFRWDWPKKINRLQVQHLLLRARIPCSDHPQSLQTMGLDFQPRQHPHLGRAASAPPSRRDRGPRRRQLAHERSMGAPGQPITGSTISPLPHRRRPPHRRLFR